MDLKKIIVKKAEELPDDVQKKHGIFGDELVEVRLFSRSPVVISDTDSFKPIKGRFSTRLRQVLEESRLLKEWDYF